MVVYRPSCVPVTVGMKFQSDEQRPRQNSDGVLIQEIDLPVNKGAQEVTLPN